MTTLSLVEEAIFFISPIQEVFQEVTSDGWVKRIIDPS